MARTKVVTRGFSQMQQNIRSIPRVLNSAAMDRAALDALEPMKAETEARARALRQPFDPPGGHLDENVVSAKVEQRSRYRRTYWIAFEGRGRKIAHLVEFGTRPHWQPNRFGGFWHPGARAKPFFRPAFESNKEKVIYRLGENVSGLIEGALLKQPGTRKRR